jgi:ubiquinone/menaquinone biosynthesis C-methylase UbiE
VKDDWRSDWRSYNPIAETYANVSEGLYFARPASDLVALLRLAPGSRVLDVGTGTGVVATLAADAVGPTGLVVGLDPAIDMLRRRPARGRVKLVAGELPQLPHPDASFDAVAAAFVLTHVPDYAAALRAMLNVLRAEGRLAIASWRRSASSTPPGEICQATANEFVAEDAVRDALRAALPWEEAFSSLAFHESALGSLGLTQVVVREVTYAIEMPTSVFIESRLLSLAARFMRVSLGPRQWARFRDEVSRRLTEVFGTRLQLEVSVNFGVGTRQADAALRHQTAASSTKSGLG